VQADDRRLPASIKVASDGIPEHDFQLIQSVRLREDRMAQGASLEAAFGRFLHREDDFALRHRSTPLKHYTTFAQASPMVSSSRVK